MKRRLFTAQEQARLEERVHDMSQAFVWHVQISRARKVKRVLSALLFVGLPLLVAICIAAYSIAFVTRIEDGISFIVTVGIITFILELIACFGYYVQENERIQSQPPVFLFFHDKLFYIQDSARETDLDFPKIPTGEIQALRRESKAISGAMTSAQIESECFFIEAIKNAELGNVIDGLMITVIENIVDVDMDEDDADFFIITYENEYDEEVELVLPMSKWSELYDWLYAQMYD